MIQKVKDTHRHSLGSRKRLFLGLLSPRRMSVYQQTAGLFVANVPRGEERDETYGRGQGRTGGFVSVCASLQLPSVTRKRKAREETNLGRVVERLLFGFTIDRQTGRLIDYG